MIADLRIKCPDPTCSLALLFIQAGDVPARLGAITSGAVHAVVLNSFDKLYVDRFGLRILTETENIDFLGSAIVTTESYARAQRDVVIRFLRSAAPKYQLKSLPGNFSGLHLVCLMYVAFKSIAPDTDVGFDLSKEYAAAQALHGEK